jgi:hypothetical protein
VHWTLKGALRRAVIALFVRLGWEPHWRFTTAASAPERSDFYAPYSMHATFYPAPAGCPTP